MPQVKEILLYTFDELEDDAKERAREWYRSSNYDCDWSEFVIDDFAAICDLIGVSLSTSPVRLMGGGTRSKPCVYWSVGGGPSFEGSYSHAKGALRAVKAYAPMDEKLHAIVERLVAVQRRNFYQLRASIRENRGSMCVDVERYSENHQDVSYSDADEVRDCLRSLADWLYNRLRLEYEYQNSDEVIDENIEANEYTFDVFGNRKD